MSQATPEEKDKVLATMREVLATFVRRVECGQVQSRRTYAAAQHALAMDLAASRADGSRGLSPSVYVNLETEGFLVDSNNPPSAESDPLTQARYWKAMWQHEVSSHSTDPENSD
jgi:hypothetical protein